MNARCPKSRRARRAPHPRLAPACGPGGPTFRASSQRGFVLAYVLFSLALLSLVTVGVSRLRSANDQSEVIAQDVSRIDHDIDLLTLAVSVCATEAPLGATVDSVNTAYPVLPDPSAPGALAFGAADATEMRCPGLPVAAQPMWTGRDGVFYPTPPPGFGPWRYSIVKDCGRVESIAYTIEAQTPAALAALRRVVLRRPAGQRILDSETGILTVQVLTDPCPV